MSNTNNFSLTGVGSSVRYGKGNGIIDFTAGTGFGVKDSTGTALATLSIATPTLGSHAATRNYITGLVGSTALSGTNGVSFNNTTGVISAVVDGSTILTTGGSLSVGTVLNANIGSGAAIAFNKLAALTASRVTVTGTDGFIAAGTVTTTELGYLSGGTENIQTSLNDKLSKSTGGTVSGNTFYTGAMVGSTALVNKGYVDSAITAAEQGLDAKESCRVATTANITLSGTQTIDGVAVIAGDRILVKNQTSAVDNGIWVVSASAWSRSQDMDTPAEITSAYSFVEEGSTQAGYGYVVVGFTSGQVIGVNNINWTQFSQAGAYTAGSGLTVTSGVFALNLAGTGGLVDAGGPLKLDLTTLSTSAALGSTDVFAISQGGSTVKSTLGSLASFIAGASVVGTDAITATAGTIALVTDANFTQASGSLHLGSNVTVTNRLQVSGSSLGTDYAPLEVNGAIRSVGFGATHFELGTGGAMMDGISNGTIAVARIGYIPGTTGAAGVTQILAGTGDAIGTFSANGLHVVGTLDASGNVTGANLSGTNTGDQTITISGDASGSGTGAITLTLGTTGVTAGTYGNATHPAIITVDAKGRVTSASTGTTTLGTGSVTSITVGSGLGIGSSITNTGTINVSLSANDGLSFYSPAAGTSQIKVQRDEQTIIYDVGNGYLRVQATNGLTTTGSGVGINLGTNSGLTTSGGLSINAGSGVLTNGTNGLVSKWINTLVDAGIGTSTTIATSATETGTMYLSRGTSTYTVGTGMALGNTFGITTINDTGGSSVATITTGTTGHIFYGQGLVGPTYGTSITIPVGQVFIAMRDGGNNWNVLVNTPAATANLSGTNTGDQTITLTGDVTGSGTGSFATTLATVNGNVGTFNGLTVNAKGLVTAAANIVASGDASGTVSGTALVLTLGTSGVTAGTASATSWGSNGAHIASLLYPTFAVDAKGRVTALGSAAQNITFNNGLFVDAGGAVSIHINGSSLVADNTFGLAVSLDGQSGLQTTNGLKLNISNLASGTAAGTNLLAIDNGGTTKSVSVTDLVNSVVVAQKSAIQGNIGSGLGTQTIGTIPTYGTMASAVARVVLKVGTALATATTAQVLAGTTVIMTVTENDITSTGVYIVDLALDHNGAGEVVTVVFDNAPTAGTGLVTVKFDTI